MDRCEPGTKAVAALTARGFGPARCEPLARYVVEYVIPGKPAVYQGDHDDRAVAVRRAEAMFRNGWFAAEVKTIRVRDRLAGGVVRRIRTGN